MSAASKGRSPSSSTVRKLRDAQRFGRVNARCIHQNNSGYCVRFKHNGKRYYAGNHKTIEAAIIARDEEFKRFGIL
jgi:hypothetical protein